MNSEEKREPVGADIKRGLGVSLKVLDPKRPIKKKVCIECSGLRTSIMQKARLSRWRLFRSCKHNSKITELCAKGPSEYHRIDRYKDDGLSQSEPW